VNPTDTGRTGSIGLPRQPGSYLLLLNLVLSTEIQVGKLGRIGFRRGWYVYTGSAFGPGGLAGRLGHHLRPVRKPHWHIDYLRDCAKVMAVWMAVGPPNREHDWAHMLARDPGAGKWVHGFGSSGCRCPSHLLYYEGRPGDDTFRDKLGACVAWRSIA
jgi:Uri superfamily endonuclease